MRRHGRRGKLFPLRVLSSNRMFVISVLEDIRGSQEHCAQHRVSVLAGLINDLNNNQDVLGCLVCSSFMMKNGEIS